VGLTHWATSTVPCSGGLADAPIGARIGGQRIQSATSAQSYSEHSLKRQNQYFQPFANGTVSGVNAVQK
jgi:hypothetical protein